MPVSDTITCGLPRTLTIMANSRATAVSRDCCPQSNAGECLAVIVAERENCFACCEL